MTDMMKVQARSTGDLHLYIVRSIELAEGSIRWKQSKNHGISYLKGPG